MAEKHGEEQAVVELEKEKQDSVANDKQQEAPSHSDQNDRDLDSKATSTSPMQAKKDQSNAETPNLSSDQLASEPPKAENGEEEEEEEEEEGECPACVFMKAGGCRDTFVNWQHCMEEAEENKEDPVQKCSHVIDLLMRCMASCSDYYAPVIRIFGAEKHVEGQAIVELEKEKLDSVTSNNEQETLSHSNQK